MGICRHGGNAAEYWSGAKSDEEDPKQIPSLRPRQVTEIFTYAMRRLDRSYVSVLSSHFAESVPELMAYMVTITRVRQDFTGLAWVRYDASFRRQAAITGTRKWSQITPSLYFMGCAMSVKRCDLCLSTRSRIQTRNYCQTG